MISNELPLETRERVEVLARRIQEVEQEIARVQRERARAGEPEDRKRIAALEEQVRAAEKRLGAQRAVRKPASMPSPASGFRTMRNQLLFVGGLLTFMGLFVGGLALRDHAEWGLVAAVGSPGVIGLFMLLKVLSAKTVADLEPGDL